MAKLTAAARRKIPKSKYALPGGRFPVEDRKHAAAAKAYATQMYDKGELSLYQRAKVNAAANAELRSTKPASRRPTTAGTRRRTA